MPYLNALWDEAALPAGVRGAGGKLGVAKIGFALFLCRHFVDSYAEKNLRSQRRRGAKDKNQDEGSRRWSGQRRVIFAIIRK